MAVNPAVRSAALQALSAKPRLTSNAILEYLQAVAGVPRETVAAVVDGFWMYVTDRANYRSPGGRGPCLVIPHFGTFRLDTRLRFHSRNRAELRAMGVPVPPPPARGGLFGKRERTPPPLAIAPKSHSAAWVQLLRPGTPAQSLSVKRRMACAIVGESQQAGNTPLDLNVVQTVLWELFDLLVSLFAAGRRPIAWAKRGVMRPTANGYRYTFRCYPSFVKWLAQA